MSETILEARGLSRQFKVKQGVVNAVNAVDLCIRNNETLALVGESGSGKTTLSRLLLLLDQPSAGQLLFRGKNCSQLGRAELREFRRTIQPVFQNPYSSLNPRLRVKHIIAEPLRAQGQCSAQETANKVAWALDATGLQARDGEKFPHQFSGGQRQRVAIARAIVAKPQLIILDEPVSSQDISIQAQILNLLKDLQAELNMSYLFIAHDLATVRFMSDRIAVMYLGNIVETGSSETVFADPQHPYTQALFNSVLPEMPGNCASAVANLGELPSPLNPPSGCGFHPRCERAIAQCAQEKPVLKTRNDRQAVACLRSAPNSHEVV